MPTRPRAVAVATALVCLFACGCGAGVGRVKGRLTDNGQPLAFAPGAQASVVFTLLGPGGQPDVAHTYTMMLEPDGRFELRASGGELPPGTYKVTLDVAGKEKAKFQRFSAKQEVKAGDNTVELDLAKTG